MTHSKTVACAWIAMLIFVASTVYAVFANYHTVPLMDHWVTLDLYGKQLAGTLGFHDFWTQHNEHRVLVPRILILADYALEGGAGYLLIGMILLLQATHALILSKAFSKGAGVAWGERLFFGCFAFMVCLWLKQRENFLWSFQITWMLNGLSVSLAVYWAAGLGPRLPEASTWRKLCLMALCCFVAAYTLASGIFLTGILFILLWRSGLSPRFLVAWILFTAALAASYLIGYHSPSYHPSPLDALRLDTIVYLLGYLGNPVLLKSPVTFIGIVAGACGLIGFCFLAFSFFRKENPSYYTRFAFGGAGYVMLAAVLTASGRHSFGVMQAAAGRYTTAVVLFWFLILSWSYARSVGRSTLGAGILSGVVGVVMLYILSTQLVLMRRMEANSVNIDEASLALMAEVGDTLSLKYVFPGEEGLWERNRFAREHNLFHYRKPWTRTRGHLLSQTFKVQDDGLSIPGSMEASRRVESWIRPGNFVWLRVESKNDNGVIVFARKDTIVGFARSPGRECSGCYTGYVSGTGDSTESYFLEAGDAPQRARKILLR